METEFQLFTIETADRAGAITAVAASLASRGVNIECFLASEIDGGGAFRRGKFVAIIEADRAYAMVLRKGLQCLDVVHEVSAPHTLTKEELDHWRARFAQVSEDCQRAVEGGPGRG